MVKALITRQLLFLGIFSEIICPKHKVVLLVHHDAKSIDFHY